VVRVLNNAKYFSSLRLGSLDNNGDEEIVAVVGGAIPGDTQFTTDQLVDLVQMVISD
jgi:hypothetical protein